MLLIVTTREPATGKQPIQQQAGEGEVAQVVGAELHLEAVLGERLRRVHHPGVVDQQVDVVVSGAELLRGGADRVQRRQVEFLQRHVRVGTALAG